MKRERAIEILEHELKWGRNDDGVAGIHDDTTLDALEMAIASLKTDEAYQLEYENRNFVEIPKGITNGEVVQALFPKIELGEIVYNTRRYFLMGEAIDTFDFKTTDKWWNAPYRKIGKEVSE